MSSATTRMHDVIVITTTGGTVQAVEFHGGYFTKRGVEIKTESIASVRNVGEEFATIVQALRQA